MTKMHYHARGEARILYRDHFERRDGSDFWTPWKKNSVVTAMNDMARAFAALLANDQLIKAQQGLRGIQYHGFGVGDPLNGSFENEAPDLDERTLFDERYRRIPSALEYIEVFTGTAETASTAGNVVDTVNRSEPDDYFNDDWVHFTAGTGAGEFRQITDFDNSTSTITFTPNDITPDATSTYEIISVQDPANPTVVHEDRKILQVRTVLNFNEPEETGGEITIREQGLFGLNATEEVDTGFSILQIRHADIVKDQDTRLTRFVRIQLF